LTSNYTASAARNPSIAYQYASSVGPSELDYSISENLAASGQQFDFGRKQVINEATTSNSLAEAFLKRKIQQKVEAPIQPSQPT
jgi:hypothetical protein